MVNKFDVTGETISIHALREEGDVVNKFDVTGETISIHALREEGDAKRSPAKPMTKISIHALREEGDIIFFMLVSPFNNFYPRPPRGGRPQVH